MSPPTRQRRPGRGGVADNSSRSNRPNDTPRITVKVDFLRPDGTWGIRTFGTIRSAEKFLARLEDGGDQVRHRILRRVVGGPARARWTEVA